MPKETKVERAEQQLIAAKHKLAQFWTDHPGLKAELEKLEEASKYAHAMHDVAKKAHHKVVADFEREHRLATKKGEPHPALIRAIEKMIGFKYEDRTTLRKTNESWAEDLFTAALRTIRARLVDKDLKIKKSNEEVRKAREMAWSMDHELRSARAGLDNCKSAIEHAEYALKMAKEEAAERTETRARRPVKDKAWTEARAKLRQILEGTLEVQW